MTARCFRKLRGKLLIALHGYRPAGARIAAFTVDRRGIPLLTPQCPLRHLCRAERRRDRQPALSGTGLRTAAAHARLEQCGRQPSAGAPVGLAVAEDGAIWVAENNNATILRIARDRP